MRPLYEWHETVWSWWRIRMPCSGKSATAWAHGLLSISALAWEISCWLWSHTSLRRRCRFHTCSRSQRSSRSKACLAARHGRHSRGFSFFGLAHLSSGLQLEGRGRTSWALRWIDVCSLYLKLKWDDWNILLTFPSFFVQKSCTALASSCCCLVCWQCSLTRGVCILAVPRLSKRLCVVWAVRLLWLPIVSKSLRWATRIDIVTDIDVEICTCVVSSSSMTSQELLTLVQACSSHRVHIPLTPASVQIICGRILAETAWWLLASLFSLHLKYKIKFI